MHILLYHPVKLPVTHYGGTERVLMWLLQGLRNRGIKVSFYAGPGSQMPEGVKLYTDLETVIKDVKEFDVIHGFTKLPEELNEAMHGKTLFTLEGNGQVGEVFPKNTVFVSQDHAKRHGGEVFVYNGLDPNELLFSNQPRVKDRFLFLSKTTWSVKNLSGAIRTCAKNDVSLWVAGGDGPWWWKAYVRAREHLGGDWHWVGSVNQSEKARFLIEGEAMIFPHLWNEPFGIVITEALVSGTPVLAHPHGSLAELLSFAPQMIMRSDRDWERALQGEIEFPSAEQCREEVLQKYSFQKMTDDYLKIYQRILDSTFLHANEPITQVGARDIS